MTQSHTSKSPSRVGKAFRSSVRTGGFCIYDPAESTNLAALPGYPAARRRTDPRTALRYARPLCARCRRRVVDGSVTRAGAEGSRSPARKRRFSRTVPYRDWAPSVHGRTHQTASSGADSGGSRGPGFRDKTRPRPGISARTPGQPGCVNVGSVCIARAALQFVFTKNGTKTFPTPVSPDSRRSLTNDTSGAAFMSNGPRCADPRSRSHRVVDS